MKLFLTLRILDIITTLLNVQKYGNWDVELNPIMRYFGSQGIYAVIGYQMLVTLFAVLVISRFRFGKLVFGGFIAISTLAIIINVWCLTL